jgi:WD40 repeat protein
MRKLLVVLFFCFISSFSFAQNFELIRSFVGHHLPSEIISFTPIDTKLLAGDNSGKLQVWDTGKQELLEEYDAHSGKIGNIEFNDYGNRFITYGEDKQVIIWNFPEMQQIRNYTLPNAISFAIFKSNSELLIGCQNGKMYIQNMDNPNYQDSIFFINKHPVFDAIISDENNQMVLTDQSSIKVIDLSKKRLKNEIKNPYNSYFSRLEYYKNSSDTIISWSKNGIISFWALPKERLLKDLKAKTDFNILAMNKFSNVLLTGYYDDRPLLFNLSHYDLDFEMNEDIHITNTHITNLSQEYMISADNSGRHRLMIIKGNQSIKDLALQKREIIPDKTITVYGQKLTIEVWDHEEVDGDKISLYCNGVWITRNYELSAEKKSFTFSLDPKKENILIFHAENLGYFPPNTTAIRILDELGNENTHIMRSNLDHSSAIEFQYGVQ